MKGKKLNDLSQSVHEAISQLMAWVKPVMHDLDNSLTMGRPDCRTVAEI